MSPALTTVGVHEGTYLEAIRRLDVHDHLCLIYETPEEQFGGVVPFIRFGLERSERCAYIADRSAADEVLDTLDAAGIDVAGAREKDALSVGPSARPTCGTATSTPSACWRSSPTRSRPRGATASGPCASPAR
jgi:hypothetical protein